MPGVQEDAQRMKPKHFLLRVHSVRKLTPPVVHYAPGIDPVPQSDVFEVRMETGDDRPASLFYKETNPRLLPLVDSVLHVTVDDRLTCADPQLYATGDDKLTIVSTSVLNIEE